MTTHPETDIPPEPAFRPAQLVGLKSDPKARGAVLEVHPSNPENRYQVFIGGHSRSYYESQLQPVETATDHEWKSLSVDRFHAHLTALHIAHPSLSTLYSLNAARVDYIPHQFRPVLKFIRADRPRLLIADGVGVGKTIEAGLILRELQARREIRSVLVICPRPLVAERKWEEEMKRFDERFVPLDGPKLRHCVRETELEGEWPLEYAKSILPYSLFSEKNVGTDGRGALGSELGRAKLLALDPPPRFDLVVVDEAHHVRNPATFAHQAVRFLCDNADAVLFLTATPIQLGKHELFVLLNLLRPDLVLDQKSFENMTEPNPHINRAVAAARGGAANWQQVARAQLDDAATTGWGSRILVNDPDFNQIRADLTNDSMDADERVRTIHRLEGLHTLSNVISRTRRRDIGEWTVRTPKTVEIPFTPEQREVHDGLLAVQREILRRLRPGVSLDFMMTTIRRQAASCLPGLAPLINDILSRRLPDLTEHGGDDQSEPANPADLLPFIPDMKAVVERAADLENTRDPKLEALLNVVRDKQDLDNNRLMVFSSFRHTLSYLERHLTNARIRARTIHGGVPDGQRRELRERFRAPREDSQALDVLLFSEVGCEGLDYQFCDCIVNYDLPWNPMRVEQRIGRIDRTGQRSPKVLIYNLITPDTVDADIYDRCLRRIGVFDNAIGASEEILGEMARQIRSIAEDIHLSTSERRAKLDQIMDNEIRVIQEEEVLEQRQIELFGVRLPADQLKKEVEEASSYWLTSDAIRNLVATYLAEVTGGSTTSLPRRRGVTRIRVSREGRSHLLADYRKRPRAGSPMHRTWERWLKGDDPFIGVTFDADTAADHREAAFVMPLHPLARQAAQALQPEGHKPFAAVRAVDPDLPMGRHTFVLYEWRFAGVREDLLLYPVTENPQVRKRLTDLLARSAPAELAPGDLPSDSLIEELDRIHHARWSAARKRHQDHNAQLVRHRIESLSVSHRARLAQINDEAQRTGDSRIRRMRQAQIENAQAEYERRISELQRTTETADITTDPVAYGVLIVEEGESHGQ